MKVFLNYFKTFFPLNVSIQSVVDILNFSGFETTIIPSYIIITIPANRSDCNSIYGIIFEIFSAIPTIFSNNVIKVSNKYNIIVENYNDSFINYVVFTINFKNYKTTPLWFIEELGYLNIKVTQNFVLNFVNYIYTLIGCFIQPICFCYSLDVFFLKKITSLDIVNGIFNKLFVKNNEFNLFSLIINKNYFNPLGIIDIEKYGCCAVNCISEVTNFIYISFTNNYFQYLRRVFSKFDTSLFFLFNEVSNYNIHKLLFVNFFLHKVFTNSVISISTSILLKYSTPFNDTFIYLRKSSFKSILGFCFLFFFVEYCIKLLKCSFVKCYYGWLIKVPFDRVNLNNESMFIDEILRFYGFNNIKVYVKNFNYNTSLNFFTLKNFFFLYDVRTFLISFGFQEVINYSFTSYFLARMFLLRSKLFVLRVRNPLNKSMEAMRTSLLCSLLCNLKENDVYDTYIKFFEIGSCFFLDKNLKIKEVDTISAVYYGKLHTSLLLNDSFNVDFMFTTLKGEVFGIFSILKKRLCLISYFLIETQFSVQFSNYRCRYNDIAVGMIGILSNKIKRFFNIKRDVLFFEFEKLFFFCDNINYFYKPYCNFPITKRDISLTSFFSINENDINFCFKLLSIKFLNKFNIYEIFYNMTSYNSSVFFCLTLYLQGLHKTLNDTEIKIIMYTIFNYLYRCLNVFFRF